MSTPQHLESAKPVVVKDTGAPSVWADQHPLFQEKPVLLAQNTAKPAIGEGPGSGNPNPNPNPNPVGEGGGKNPVSSTSTSSSESTAISSSTSTSTATGIGEGGNGGQGGQGGKGGQGGQGGIGEGGKGGNASATGGDATAKGGTAKSSSIGEGGTGQGGIGEGGTGTGGSATGGANNLNESSVVNFPRQTVPVIPFTPAADPCVAGMTLGGATPWGGLTFGRQHEDKGCAERAKDVLQFQKDSFGLNLDFQKGVEQDNVKLGGQTIEAQKQAAIAQADAAVQQAKMKHDETVVNQTCNFAAVFGDKAYAGYNNVQGAGKELNSNPLAKGVANSESILTTNFAVGSSQLIAQCSAALSGNPDIVKQFSQITASDLTPSVPSAPPGGKRIVTNSIPRPRNCSTDDAALRGFLAAHPTMEWSADDKSRMTTYLHSTAKLKASESAIEKKNIGDK